MSDNGKGKTALLLGSVGTNIFLVAFILGRLSSPGMMFPGHEHGGMHGPGPWMMEAGGPPGGPGMPHSPPMFGPDDVFSAEEMQQNMKDMQQNFEKVQTMRQEFAAKLEQGKLSKEDVLKHFTDIDAVMNGVKEKVQEKMAEKISAMSDDDRKKFAARLKHKCVRSEGGPDGAHNGPPSGGEQGGPPPGPGGPDGAGEPPPPSPQ